MLEVVDALNAPGRLHGRQQEGEQDRDDREHHQQLDQRETTSARRRHGEMAPGWRGYDGCHTRSMPVPSPGFQVE
jgi:hypothetical protein